jgi:hypothetical protein
VAEKRSPPFRAIASAPRDGSLIEVRHGRDRSSSWPDGRGRTKPSFVMTIRYAEPCIASLCGVQRSPKRSRAGGQ